MFAKRTGWPLSPNRLTECLRHLRAEGCDILDLTESNPTRCGFQYDKAGIFAALADRAALAYDPDPRGLVVARQAVAGYYRESGARISPRQIFLTTSTSEAYSHVFRLLADSGDAVLVPRPSYPLFEFLAGLNDVALIPYPLRYHDGWEIEFEGLVAAVHASKGRARAVLVVHPNNPTGSFVSQGDVDKLSALCRDHGMAIVADEVFRDFTLEPGVSSVLTHASEVRALTFTLSGLSKISALPQMKLAWLVASGPAELLSQALARLEVIADTYLSVSAPTALALPRLLEMRATIQPQILGRLRGNLQILDESLRSASPVSRLRMQGGWYAVLRVPATGSDEDWAVQLLTRQHLFVHPGHFYDFESDGYLIVSLLPPHEVFREGIRKLLEEVAR
ncbi:MAG: pyridoxal phosphate-dependent aminotransferase [Acidobacteria bacterium]|nr:pyridoxal phosphate-dependent aminotransferase [Acidobacteriota bacterium]